jgi:hypothetical protein
METGAEAIFMEKKTLRMANETLIILNSQFSILNFFRRAKSKALALPCRPEAGF